VSDPDRAYIGEILQEAIDAGTAIDLGNDHWATFYTGHGDETNTRIGAQIYHKASDGDWCVGSVLFDIPEAQRFPGAKWTLHSLDPLHIEPSVACGGGPWECSDHGFIREGRWVPA
jgi:hypothetical protein